MTTGPATNDAAPQSPGAGWRATLGLLARLPQGTLSRATGRLADLRIPTALRASVFGVFARAAGIDVGEMEGPLSSYETLDGFFTRRLRDGVRTWPADADAITSPVDGVVGQHGRIERGRMLQAKGREYSAADLLADAEGARTFDDGMFLTLYLGPRHYHRVHSPAALRVVGARHVPGALMPVNAPAIAGVRDLFPRNERLVCLGESRIGRIAIIAVGAFNVGRITAAFDDSIATNTGHADIRERSYDPVRSVGRGEELMTFHLGSTVVLLFERGRIRLDDGLAAGREIRLGRTIARPAAD